MCMFEFCFCGFCQFTAGTLGGGLNCCTDITSTKYLPPPSVEIIWMHDVQLNNKYESLGGMWAHSPHIELIWHVKRPKLTPEV